MTGVTGRLVALLVGIDAYPAPLPPLEGCVNDVRAFEALLRHRVPADTLDLRVLLDGDATRDATIAALRGHLGTAGPGDVALFHFSGHGSQGEAPPELWALEPDHRCETLVLVDSRRPGQWDLADKELAALLAEVAATGAHVVTVLDCCHSGDGTRAAHDAGRPRLAPDDDRHRPFATFLPGTDAAAAGGPVRSIDARWSAGGGSQVLLAACRSSETAKEMRVLGRPRGALTFALETALLAGGHPTYRQLHRLATAAVQRRVQEQHPQLEATVADDIDRPFLGGAVPAAPTRLLLTMLPDGWCLDAGAVHGISGPHGGETTEAAVHPLESDDPETPLATARVLEVLPDRSRVLLSAELDPSRAYRAVITSLPLPPVRFAVLGDGEEAAALRAAVLESGPVLVEPCSSVADADLVVDPTAPGFTVTRPGAARPVVTGIGGEDRVPRTLACLDHVARWLRLVDLRNPSTTLPPDVVAVRLESPDGGRAGDDGILTIAYAGETPPPFRVSLTNTSERPLWCALLDLTDAYGIFADALPSGSVALGPGETIRLDLVGQVPDAAWAAGVDRATDHLKVVVSTLEFDPRSLQQDDLTPDAADANGPARRGGGTPRTTLERLLGQVTTRRLGPRADAAEADWRTDDVWVVTSRPRPGGEDEGGTPARTP